MSREGELIDGQFEGVVRWVYPASKRVRLAFYHNGSRVRWITARGPLLEERPSPTDFSDAAILETMFGPDGAYSVQGEEEEEEDEEGVYDDDYGEGGEVGGFDDGSSRGHSPSSFFDQGSPFADP